MATKQRRAPLPQSPSSSTSSSSSSSSEEEEVEEEHSHKEQAGNSKPDPQKQAPKSERVEEEEPDENPQPQPVKSTPSKPEPQPQPEKMAKEPGGPIIRSWTFEDEISILEAMVEYQTKNGSIKLTAEGVRRFHDSVRESLSKHVSNIKFADKLRKMRAKHNSANKKGDKLKFAKPHDKIVYELSKKIWGEEKEEKQMGEEDGNNSGGIEEGKSLKRDFPFIRDAMGGNRLALEMLDMVDEKKAMDFEKKFKKLKFAEFDLIRKAYNFLCEEAKHLMN